MDPTVCLQEILNKIAQHRQMSDVTKQTVAFQQADLRDEISAQLSSLRQWIKQGGFMPDLNYNPSLKLISDSLEPPNTKLVSKHQISIGRL